MGDGVMLAREHGRHRRARGGRDVLDRHALEHREAEHLALLGRQFGQGQFELAPHEFAQVDVVGLGIGGAEQDV